MPISASAITVLLYIKRRPDDSGRLRLASTVGYHPRRHTAHHRFYGYGSGDGDSDGLLHLAVEQLPRGDKPRIVVRQCA